MAKSANNLNAVFKDTANAIRSKTGKNGLITPRDFADEVNSIETGIEPTGTINITINGDHDVAEYGIAHVEVPSYPEPTGTKYISSNGNNIDVKNYAKVNVGVYPSGRIDIINNGDYQDVSDYQQANIHVPYFVADHYDYSHNSIRSDENKILAIDDETQINNYQITQDSISGDFTFTGELSGTMEGLNIQNDNGPTLITDDGWVVDIDEYNWIYVRCGILLPSGCASYADVSGLRLNVDSTLSTEEVQDYLASSWNGSYVVFVDLLGNEIARVKIENLAGVGGSGSGSGY